jgi:hypothetical protein
MHGGGAKRVRFKKNQIRVKFKIYFKFGLKIKKILGGHLPRRQTENGDVCGAQALT